MRNPLNYEIGTDIIKIASVITPISAVALKRFPQHNIHCCNVSLWHGDNYGFAITTQDTTIFILFETHD